MKPSQKPAEIRTYDLLRKDGHDNWARVIICSDGFFSVISDYGNYGHWWSSFGDRDFRLFLLDAEKDVDYFTKKLQHGGDGPGDVYDGELTAREIKNRILELRRNKEITAKKARRELEELEDSDVVGCEVGFWEWRKDTSLFSYGEIEACHTRNPQTKAFVKKILIARLCPVFREELKAEGLLKEDT